MGFILRNERLTRRVVSSANNEVPISRTKRGMVQACTPRIRSNNVGASRLIQTVARRRECLGGPAGLYAAPYRLQHLRRTRKSSPPRPVRAETPLPRRAPLPLTARARAIPTRL